MKIDHLEELLALSEILNFSKAAESLNISQPVLSAHIKGIESELGIRLFNRDKHSVYLTEAGVAILPGIHNLVEQYNQIEHTALQFMMHISSSLEIGYLFNAYQRAIPHIARRFSNELPDIELNLHSMNFRDLTDSLMNDQIDIALTIDVDETMHSLFNCEALCEDVICCVVRRDDPLAHYESISIQDLEGEPLILPSPEYSSSYDHFIRSMFCKEEYTPLVSVLYHEIDTRYLAIEAGDGIGLVGKHFQPYMNSNLRFIPLEDDCAKYNLAAMWKKTNQNQNIARFIEIATNEFKSTPR